MSFRHPQLHEVFFRERFHRRFVVGRHHIQICEALDKVLDGSIRKLIINIAPRFGKTELAVKNFIAMGLALNAKAKFIHLSYSDDLARDNSNDVLSLLEEPEYKRMFEARASSTGSKKWYTEQGGGLYAVSSSGQVTGFGAGLVDLEERDALDEFTADATGPEFGGAIIIDDPIKPDDALSATIREKVNNKFDTTIRNRVNSRHTPIIIIMQRLHQNDLCGYLMSKEPDDWTVLSLPAVYEEEGERHALWPFKMTLEELDDLRQKNTFVFDTQYMQNPTPLQGLMYEAGFREYSLKPATRYTERKAYVDTADTGADYLCAIVYDETEAANYVVDVLYTRKPMEFTEPALAKMLSRHKVSHCMVESNNGGRSFARAVEQQCRLMNNNHTRFKWLHQSNNKEMRIFSNSAAVQNLTYMPQGWRMLYPDFAGTLTGYMKVGNNPHDDAPDCLTGTVEHRRSQQKTDASDIFGF